MRENPYSLMFGQEPEQMISRMALSDEIYDSFLSKAPSQMIYMITGVRGAGKTVLMTEIANTLRKNEDWVTIELNPARDLLLGLAAKLYNESRFMKLFEQSKINLSFFGIGIEIAGAPAITDIEAALTKMLDIINKQGKRVLVTIDEVINSDDMKVFASAYQIFIRQGLPLFLIMTGLYDNIDALQNEKILTFLHRAPKIRLKPLNIRSIAEHYKNTLEIDDNSAKKMADITRGYPFAFQVLGYYTYENKGDYIKAMPDYRQRLEEYVYDKIWSELSTTDKRVAHAIACVKSGKIVEIRSQLHMEPNEFAPYRDRLIKKGIINGEERGTVRFELPLFEEYVKDKNV